MNKRLVFKVLVGLALMASLAFAGPTADFIQGIYTELITVARLIGGIIVIFGVIGVATGVARPASLIGMAFGVFVILKADIVVGWLQSI